jgi:leader peptidase (prepilin peptidase)/N-methyltransferase
MSETTPHWLVALILFLVGLPIGSFLNVVAYRLPRGQSPWKPSRSHCPECDAQIRARDNLPVVGWLILRGRCRDCGAQISWRYPAFELLTAVLFAAVGLRSGLNIVILPELLFVATLVTITNSDLDSRIIPNMVIVPSLAAGIIAQALARPDLWKTWTLSAVIAFSAMFLIALAYPRGMGMGDVKLAGVMGLYLGRAVAPALLIAFALGTIVGIGVMASRGVAAGRKTKLPFGPFMAAGGIIGMFAGETMVQWYLDTFTQSQ